MDTANLSNAKAERSRGALLDAFRELVLKTRYDEVKVSQIVARARVARSTFYAHYQSKDQLLLEGLSGPFAAMADAVVPGSSTDDLTTSLEHFWEHRRVARALLSGPMGGPLHRLLVSMVQRRLQEMEGEATNIPPRLIANQIAGGQIAVVLAWVSGEAPCKPDQLARSMQLQTLSLAGRDRVQHKLSAT